MTREEFIARLVAFAGPRRGPEARRLAAELWAELHPSPVATAS